MMAKGHNFRYKLLTSISFLFALLFVTTYFFINNSALLAQDEIKVRVFQEVTDLLNQAKAEQANLLSPTSYAKALEKYELASKDFDRGKNVQKKIKEIKELLEFAIKTAKLVKVSFPHLLLARENARKAKAMEFAKDLYEKAEELFIESAKTLEKGDIHKAKEKSLQAERAFQEAKVAASKASIVGNVKILHKQALENDVYKYAPFTFNLSKRLLAEAEKVLSSDRSDKTEARKKAEIAEYEIKHATYLANMIKELRKDDLSWERLILQDETYLTQIITQLGITPEFDQGFEKPVNSSVEAIKNLKQEKQQLANEISSLNQTIESLNKDIIKLRAEQDQTIVSLKTDINNLRVEKDQTIVSLKTDINNLRAELDKTKEQEAVLKKKLALEQQQRDKFKKVESIFSKDEAKVLREGNQIRIRLSGLSFQTGKAIIDPDYFSLLAKLQNIIKLFPDYHITIEGHTDNKGDNKANQLLSLSRAEAVKAYLMANIGLGESQISAIGYGESKPIASNETKYGRAQNRRIDVVLSPR